MKPHSHFNPYLEMLLNRLEHVRPAGNSYRARCPVHQGKSRDSLKITSCDDGRILIHCHSQACPPLEILKVCGLDMTDIMPERLTHNAIPAELRKRRYLKLTEENKMSKPPNKPIDTLQQAASLMTCMRKDKVQFSPIGLKALEGIEALIFQAIKDSPGSVQIRDRDEIIRRLYEMTSLNTDPLWAGLDVYDYCTDSSGMGDVGADRELMEKAKATFDDVLNQFHSEAANPYLVLWGMARSMKEFMAQTEGVSLSKTEPEEPKKVDPIDFLGDGDIEF